MVDAMNESVPERFEACHMLRPLGYYLIFLWIFGTALNGSILWVLIRNKKLRSSSTNVLIAGLIGADFIGAFFEIPLPAFSLIYCRWDSSSDPRTAEKHVRNSPRWIFAYAGCVFEAIVSYFAGCSNMYMLCLISIDRWELYLLKRSIVKTSLIRYMVVTKYAPSKAMTIRRTYVSMGCAYVLALFWTAMPLIGWSSYDYEVWSAFSPLEWASNYLLQLKGIGVSCSIKWEERSLNVISYNVTILTFVYLVPIMVIAITNIKVYQMVGMERKKQTEDE